MDIDKAQIDRAISRIRDNLDKLDRSIEGSMNLSSLDPVVTLAQDVSIDAEFIYKKLEGIFYDGIEEDVDKL